jgi:hypothetical protein
VDILTEFCQRLSIRSYNVIRAQRLQSATIDAQFPIASVEDRINVNDMAEAPWPFDLAEIAPAVLLFGNMGPAIVGSQEHWANMYENESQKGTTQAMRTTFERLNRRDDLTEIQKLTFKPAVDLTPEERARMVAAFGSDINPLVEYLEQRRMASTNPFGTQPTPNRPTLTTPATRAAEKAKAAKARIGNDVKIKKRRKIAGK